MMEKVDHGNKPALKRDGMVRRSRLWVHVLLLLTGVLLAFPMFHALLIATQAPTDVYRYPPYLIPGGRFLENLTYILETRHLARSMFFTAVIAVVVVIGKTITSLLAGMVFVYFRFPLRGLLFYVVLFSLMLPTEVILIALFRLVTAIGLVETPLALIVPFLASATGAFLFQQHFLNVPAELVESALIDGSGPLRFLRSVLIPLSWNVITALAVIQFVYVWNQYLWPLVVLSKPEYQVIQVELGRLITSDVGSKDYGPIMTGAIVASLPPLLMFILLQRKFLQAFGFSHDK